MTTTTAGGLDTRIARTLAQRAALGDFAYLAMTVLLGLLLGLWDHAPLTWTLLILAQLVAGVVRRRLTHGFDVLYPADPRTWLRRSPRRSRCRRRSGRRTLLRRSG